MTTLEIKEKLENAMAKASKISTTIDKLKKQATKKLYNRCVRLREMTLK